MTLSIDWLTIDTPDPVRLVKFWSAALDYQVIYSSTDEQTHEDEPPMWDGEEGDIEILIGGNGRPRILLLEVHDAKTTKNRLHLDLRPDDLEAEVERLIGLGAKKIDIGQGDVSWVVMADPDGNEFCILRAGTSEELAEREEMEARGKW